MKPALSRRSVALGLAALPTAGSVAATIAATDPHLARAPEALALWRQHKATAWGWGEAYESPADVAASEAHWAVMDHAKAALDLPSPATVAGLGAFALSLALAHEGFYGGEGADLQERCFASLLAAVLRVTGTPLPADFASFVRHGKGDAPAMAEEPCR